jgi:hypothetical protein
MRKAAPALLSTPAPVLRGLFSAALVVAASGCASTAPSYESQPSISGSGYSSSVGSSFSGGDGFSAPQRQQARGELVVRPDAIVIVFAVKETNADAQKAIASLQAFTADIARRFQEATSGASSMKMCGASVQPVSKGKVKDSEVTEYAVIVDGSIEIALAPEQDYWARSRLLAAITLVTRAITEPPAPPSEGGAEKEPPPAPSVRFDQPQILVKDPEIHRAKLTERWIKRARDLAAAAQDPAAPLHLMDCAPPAPIEQRPISLEEIALTLAVTCRVDALHAK